jgi:hypothetical protein
MRELVKSITTYIAIEKDFNVGLRFDKAKVRMELKENMIIPSKLTNTD